MGDETIPIISSYLGYLSPLLDLHSVWAPKSVEGHGVSDELIECLDGAQHGVPPFSPGLAEKLLVEFGHLAGNNPSGRADSPPATAETATLPPLTERQRELHIRRLEKEGRDESYFLRQVMPDDLLSFGLIPDSSNGVDFASREASADQRPQLVINGGGTRTTPLEIDSLYQEIRELAEVFDVSARGEELIAELQQRADAATDRIEASDRTMAFWFADTKTPYVAGGLGSANLLATTVGAENVFADLDDDWPAVGWETVVERDPDVLVLGDLQRDRFPGDRLADKEAFLAADPLTSTMPAVQQERYIALHGAEMNPSIRFVDGLEKIADGLARLGTTS